MSRAHVTAPATVATANPSPASPSHQAMPATASRRAASTVSRTAYSPHFSVPDSAPAVAAWRLKPRTPNAMITTPAPENVGSPTGVHTGVLTTTRAARARPNARPAGRRRTRRPVGGKDAGPAAICRADRTARVASCIRPFATPQSAKNAPQ